ncbi:SsgA family sporulation/cell division regulator [Kitasatospora sp. MBT63]|uniref:SsgA family sporulation/cell division regulator n=1 Tax=Kitasatospora sp. MBT63 TaxID=1444768 RepID=UPI000689DC74|nr:SsgA family sporulation/cell division regulator [Kitasatospora sp. MBT63]
MNGAIQNRVPMILRVTDDLEIPLMSELSYDPGDPLAVSITFNLSPDEEIPWVFAREVLLEGLTKPSGQGYIHIRPAGRLGTLGDVHITLFGPAGPVELAAPIPPLVAFLDRSDQTVPIGEETSIIDAAIDSFAHALFAPPRESGFPPAPDPLQPQQDTTDGPPGRAWRRWL